VAGVILGWALAQQPLLLQHLTLRAAAAPRQTLITLLVAIAMGALILFPSLGLLFTLVLGGRFDPGHGHTATWRSAQAAAPAPPAVARAQGALAPTRAALVVRVALAAALGGIGLLTVAEAPWAHAAGVVCLFAAVIAGVVAVDPARLARAEDRSTLRD
jgi:cytochrome d ubiquinol oxidase subunit II